MSKEVVGWLNEVKDLQQQVKAARAAEQSAHASIDNWRKRYEIEAEQRRTETLAMQNTIALLRAELDRLNNQPIALILNLKLKLLNFKRLTTCKRD